jgi:hypothetical protein
MLVPVSAFVSQQTGVQAVVSAAIELQHVSCNIGLALGAAIKKAIGKDGTPGAAGTPWYCRTSSQIQPSGSPCMYCTYCLGTGWIAFALLYCQLLACCDVVSLKRDSPFHGPDLAVSSALYYLMA